MGIRWQNCSQLITVLSNDEQRKGNDTLNYSHSEITPAKFNDYRQNSKIIMWTHEIVMLVSTLILCQWDPEQNIQQTL